MINDSNDLKAIYDSKFNLYDSLSKEIKKQITYLLDENNITLAVPMSYRIKEWSSIKNKVQGKDFTYENLADINDLAGIRIIVLFQSDVIKIQEILRNNFVLKREEDTSSRLADNQFGYGSIHFEVSMPPEWIAIPTNRYFESLIVEIQLRTIAQHTWAAASHVLNYKKEKDVPLPVKRSINRVAALLETVDLEYERVLINRIEYSKKPIDKKDTLNVDLLIHVMDDLLPTINKDDEEEYSEILEELLFNDITTVESLETLINKNISKVLNEDREKVKEIELTEDDWKFNPDHGLTTVQRQNQGVFFTHSGLIRGIIDNEFGKGNTERSADFVAIFTK